MKVGAPRFGWLIDGDPETPAVNAVLVDDGERILLRVLWRDDEPSGTVNHWHLSSDFIRVASPHAYRSVPPVLWFQDLEGVVALVECRIVGAPSNRAPSNLAPYGTGELRIDVRWAVIGGSTDFRRVNGVRTEIAGLAEWVGVRTFSERTELDNRHRVQAVDLKLRTAPPIPLARVLNTQLRPTFRVERPQSGGQRAVAYEGMEVETRAVRARPLAEHLRVLQSGSSRLTV